MQVLVLNIIISAHKCDKQKAKGEERWKIWQLASCKHNFKMFEGFSIFFYDLLAVWKQNIPEICTFIVLGK